MFCHRTSLSGGEIRAYGCSDSGKGNYRKIRLNLTFVPIIVQSYSSWPVLQTHFLISPGFTTDLSLLANYLFPALLK